MDYKEYQQNALRTESHVSVERISEVIPREVIIGLLTVIKGFTEIVDMYKKHIYYGREYDWREADLLSPDSLLKMSEQPEFWKDVGLLSGEFPFEIHDDDLRLLHTVLGIMTEAGEMASALIPLFAKGELDKVNFLEELGDAHWYEAIAYNTLRASEEDNRKSNIAKLRARFPDKFDSYKAINRDVEEERKILEEGDIE